MDDRLRRHPLGFWQLKEPPDSDTLRAYYADRYYQESRGNYRREYSAEEIAWFRIRIERIAAAAAAARGDKGAGRLLDVGCGEGFAMDRLSRSGWTVHGLDYSRAGLEAMNPHLLDRIETGDLPALLEDHASAGHRYDLVWLTNVLEHVEDPVALLTRLRGLVSPGGACVVTVPNDASDWQEFLYSSNCIPERFWIAIPDHLSYFDLNSLRATATATGWRCARVMADFPIDWFLGNPESEYVSDKSRGPGAHRARVAVDTVLAEQPVEKVNDFYAAMAEVGMGRQLTAILA